MIGATASYCTLVQQLASKSHVTVVGDEKGARIMDEGLEEMWTESTNEIAAIESCKFEVWEVWFKFLYKYWYSSLDVLTSSLVDLYLSVHVFLHIVSTDTNVECFVFQLQRIGRFRRYHWQELRRL